MKRVEITFFDFMQYDARFVVGTVRREESILAAMAKDRGIDLNKPYVTSRDINKDVFVIEQEES